MIENISNLITMSNALGKQIAYVQGGGGNTSLKMSHTEMFIKSSGKFLADIEDETGFLSVDWQLLKSKIQACVSEQDYYTLLTESQHVEDKTRRPSIETGFHAILNKCTIHTHSVWANLLTCSVEGKRLVRDIFPSAIWVSYATPGLALTQAILKKLDNRQDVTIFLQNHGIVVSGPSLRMAYEMHEGITATIRKAYPNIGEFGGMDKSIENLSVNGLLFPDQAIYHSSPELANSRAGRETMLAYLFIMKGIKKAGLTPCFIDDAESRLLLNMESEKFRQRLVK